jgi:hypothetical protein
MIVSLPWELNARPPQDSPGLRQLCLLGRLADSESLEEVDDNQE